jgi:hypothetical protein
MLGTQLSTSKEAREKLVANLASWKTRCNPYRQEYHYWKAKVVYFLAQLSYVPWLWDMLWSRGFHWGFKSYRRLYVNQARFDIDLATVESNYLSPPKAAMDEMVDSGQELVPDALEVNLHGYHPTPF